MALTRLIEDFDEAKKELDKHLAEDALIPLHEPETNSNNNNNNNNNNNQRLGIYYVGKGRLHNFYWTYDLIEDATPVNLCGAYHKFGVNLSLRKSIKRTTRILNRTSKEHWTDNL